MSLFGPPDVQKLKAKRDVKGLIKASTYRKDWYVRQKALLALADLDCKDALNVFIDHLTDEESLVRETALEILTKIGGEAVTARIVQFLAEEQSSLVQRAAVHALEKLGWTPPGQDRTAAIYWVNKVDFEKCADCGEYAIEPLLSWVVDGNWKASAAYARLGEPALKRLMDETRSLIGAYWKLTSEIKSLDFLDDTDRNKAATIKAIVQKLTACFTSIGEFGDLQAQDFLIGLYQFVKANVYSNPAGGFLDMFYAVTVRSKIIVGLRVNNRQIAGVKTLALLVDVLKNDPAVFVRWEAIDSVKELADRSKDVLSDPIVVDALKASLVLEDNYLRDERSRGFTSDVSSRRGKILALLEMAEKK